MLKNKRFALPVVDGPRFLVGRVIQSHRGTCTIKTDCHLQRFMHGRTGDVLQECTIDLLLRHAVPSLRPCARAEELPKDERPIAMCSCDKPFCQGYAVLAVAECQIGVYGR